MIAKKYTTQEKKPRRLQAARGYFILLVLVFSGIFMLLIASLTGFIFVQQKVSLAKDNQEKALHIAEAGLEYYRWHLAHFSSDLKDGTNGNGPYVHTYTDPEGGTLGQYSLAISGTTQCGALTSIAITSTGTVTNVPQYPRVLYATYAQPSVADYAYIINSNVWAGADRVISGKYKSNGGVRMDGTTNSTVSSAVATWLCTSSFGCASSQTVPGVYNATATSSLWKYPVPPVDFNAISVNLADLETKAKASGVYVAPSNAHGYHVVFKNNGSIDVYKVTSTTQVWGYTTENGEQLENNVIAAQTFVANYAIPSSCSVIFVEDKVWLDGVVKGHVTLAAADVDTANVDPSVILNDNITYNTGVGTDGVTVIGEQDVLIGLQTPDSMTLNGIFIAQKGRFGRNHYDTSGSYGLPSALDPYVFRTQLTVNGTIVSYGREGTKWTSNGTWVSGYGLRINNYDRQLAANPPPFTPYTSSTFTFTKWLDNSN